ncbi:MAG: 30S ribosomal protein S6 [Phycisphaerae bacterium]|nr:30S ribosomal protein S6 [Phycisphaerae bacterium]
MASTTPAIDRVCPYEGMFLFPQSAAADLAATVQHVRDILQRGEAEVISLVKWDERRLAYDIKGNKRGLYLLAYFRAPTKNLARIERDCNLSELILRSMVLRADHVLPEHMLNPEGNQRLLDEIALRGQQAMDEEDSRGAGDAERE